MAELSISRAWDETRTVIARDGSLLTTIALALFVLPGVVSDVAAPEAPAGQLPKFGYWTVLTIIALLITLVGQLAVIRLAIGSGLTVGEAIRHGARRTPAYLAATLMWLLPFLVVAMLITGKVVGPAKAASPAAALGLILLCGVLLFFAIRMLMTSPVASAEPVGPVEILRRSWQLTRGHWLRLFGFFVAVIIAAVVTIIAVSAVGGILAQLIFGGVAPLTVGALLVALLIQVVSALVSVILMVMLARIYVQLGGEGAAVKVPTSGT
ncbi:glycerophosphoryl diester phosphodiesterase membrane domain-containing protein [Sphingomonas sp.]|uniref:glycerophosphoryl diester phosphodiesterase membrane domain-containing protein n=1 Tax=Sphingomonas sp. TaxID=28214 RepID=UPI00286A69B6|nr:glycerophosphoryl diester phosphodiesterase membrane domain-containing protein [Sphingomonas sp.]